MHVPPLQPSEEEGETPPVDALRDEDLDIIFLRLVHVALACRRWRSVMGHVAALPYASLLLSYFFHPSANFPPNDPIHYLSVFAPVNLYSRTFPLGPRTAPPAACPSATCTSASSSSSLSRTAPRQRASLRSSLSTRRPAATSCW
jgi:hypothetical protein